MTRQWFNSKECVALEIKKYKSISAHEITNAVTIEDSKVVEDIMQRIEHIPMVGDMMVSFGPNAERISLFFHCANKTIQTINIYQKRFKTPSTGFNSERNEAESSLYSDIDALLFPDLKKKTLKIKNLKLKFVNFSLTYLGETHSEKQLATVSWEKYKFLIISGQQPPMPYQFIIDGSGFTLMTYQTEMKERLFPDYFQVLAR
jgi:hypothetical protein